MPRPLPGETYTPDERAERARRLGDRVCWDGCQRDNPVWVVPNQLWQQVMGPHRRHFVLCPVCFIREAEALDVGVCDAWRISPGSAGCGPPSIDLGDGVTVVAR